MASEDVLRSDDVGLRVVRGGAARIVGFGVANVLAAVASVFLLRHLGVVDFGRYGTVMALLAIVSGVTDAGLTMTGTRELSVRTGADRDRMAGLIVGMRTALTVAGIGFAVAFAAVAGYGDRLVLGTLLAGAGIVLSNAHAAMLLPLGVELRNVRITVAEVLRNLFQVIGVAALALAGAAVVPFLALQIAVGLALLAATPALVRPARVAMPRVDWLEWRRIARSTAPVAAAFVLGILYFRILVVLMSVMSSERETGLFVTSSRIMEMVAGLPLLLTGVAMPVVSIAAHENPERLRYVLQRMTEVALIAGTFIALLIAIAAEPVIVLLGGEEYRDAAPVLRVQGLSTVTIFLIQAWVTPLVATGEQRRMAIATAFGLVAVTGLGAALIAPLDADGAALAAAIGDALLAGAMYIALRRAGPGRGLRFGFAFRVLLATAIACTPLLLEIPDAVRAAIAAVLFAAAVALLRLIPSEVRDALRRS